MDSSFLNVPTASSIVFSGPSAVSDPGITFIGAPTASDILFAGASEVSGPQENLTVGAPSASDIVFAGASKVSGRRKSLVGAHSASDIVFAGASKVSGRRNSLIGVPTVSDIVFAGASKVSGPRDERTETHIASDPATRETEFVRSSSTIVDVSESNHMETQVTERDLRHESPGIEATESLSFQNHVWNRDEIHALFDLFDADNDGYLTANDLVAFTHMFEVQTGGEKLKRYRRKKEDFGRGKTLEIIEKAGPDARIDVSNFLKLVHQMDIDLDKPANVQNSFLEFVRRRLVHGFALRSSLRKLVIRFYITSTEKREKELISKGMIECTEQFKTLFNAFDDDGDGYLLTGEVKAFTRIWGKESEEVEKIIRQVELLYNGRIDFRNLLGLLQPADIDLIKGTYALSLVPLLNRIFRLLDHDNDGSVTLTEVETFKRIWKTNPNEVESIADKIDIPPGNHNFGFPDLFNLLPLRMKSFFLKNFNEDIWLDSQLKLLFSLLDEDDDGCISVQEVKTFTSMWPMMPKEARYIIDKAEEAGDRIFHFPDFLNLLPTFEIDLYLSEVYHSSSSSKPVQHELITQMNHVFCSLDEDRDGRLTTKQVEAFLRIWRLEPNLASDIISAVDASGNGTIDFPYFLELLYSNDKMLANETQDKSAIDNLVEMFRFLDENMDSCLTTREVEILACKYMDLDENDADEIMAEVHAHGQGLFDFPTLLNLFYPKSSELQFRLYADSEIAAVRRIFNCLPRTPRDCITEKQIVTFARICKLNQTTTQDIMSKLHADGNGAFITLPQLFHLLCKAGVNFEEMDSENKKLEDKLEDIFNLFDEDKDGILRLDEMKKIWGMWKPNSPENEIDDLLHSLQAQGMYAVDFPNFLRLLYSTDIHPGETMRSKVKDDKDAVMYAFLSDIFK